MKPKFSNKTLACLQMCALRSYNAGWDELYDASCARWSEKAVICTFESLAARGYTDYGVSARTGWLTEKGEKAYHEEIASRGLRALVGA